MRAIIAALAVATLGACATAPLPDPPLVPPQAGPDIYKCAEDSYDRYLRINSTTFQVWYKNAWGANACTVPGDSCQVGADGKITVRRSITLIEGKAPIEAEFVYDLAAGTEKQTSTVDGKWTEASYSTRTPFIS